MKIETSPSRVKAHEARMSGRPDCDVVVVGAGPYGLSAATYLKAKGLSVRIFGQPMEFWATKMPEGMLLRSPRVASTIADPQGAFTLEAYESASGTEAAAPVSLKTFVEYGKWFRHQLGSDLDTTEVAEVRRDNGSFAVTLEDGSSLKARRLVVATGIGPFRYKPEVFCGFPIEQVSHCYEGRSVREFAGQSVAVIGAGQSALESAALLHEAGAEVEIISRIADLRWIGMHTWLHHMGPISKALYAKHDVGPIGISRLVACPNLCSYIPIGLRDKIRKRAVRAAGSRWLPERLVNVKKTTGRSITQVRSIGERLELKLDDGSERRVDHVLLGTGYRVDIAKYDFLSRNLVSEIEQLDGYPKVGYGFRSSVPGLHFVGATAARSFGPLLYFVTGTEFTSKQLSSYISRHSSRS